MSEKKATIKRLKDENLFILSVRDFTDEDVWQVVIDQEALEQIYSDSGLIMRETAQ